MVTFLLPTKLNKPRAKPNQILYFWEIWAFWLAPVIPKIRSLGNCPEKGRKRGSETEREGFSIGENSVIFPGF